MGQKILFVVDSLYPLGAAYPLRQLALGLSDFEVHIAALDEPFDHGYTSQYPNVVIHGLRKGKLRAGSQFILARRLQKLIRKFEPAIVHGWCEPAFSIAALALRSSPGIRFFGTELSEQFEKPIVQWWLEQRYLRKPETMVVPHESLGQHLDRQGLDFTYQTVPNAASETSVSREVARSKLIERLGIPNDSKIAVAYAPLEARFRLKDLIWATDLLNCVRDDFHFALFGDGVQERQLRRFLSCTEASGHVHFLGQPKESSILLAGGDVYWHSHLKSPLASSLLHAMANGLPAISVFGPSLEAIVDSQTTALGVSYGARDEFARWTKYLIELPNSAAQLSRQGKEHVLNHFPAANLIDSYRKLYK